MHRGRSIFLLLVVCGCCCVWPATELGAIRPLTRGSQQATQAEKKLLAEKAIEEGKQFEARGTADSFRKALESYEKARDLWRAIENRRGEAETLGRLGVVHYFLDEKQEALEAFKQELQFWRAAGGHVKEAAEALNNIGVVYGSLGLSQKSVDSYQEALALRRAAGDRPGIANSLDNIGLACLDAGELQQALDYFNQALPLYRELNMSDGIANALNNIGGVHFTWGDYRKALEYFSQALEMRRALGQRRQEAIALNNIGRVHQLLGDAQKAMDYHRQALELRRVLGQRSMEAASINNIALVYDWLGDTEKAMEYYQQALAIFRATNDRNGEASALNNIASVYIKREPQKGLEYERQALEIRRALGQRIEEAVELDNIGFIQNKLGDPRKALEYHHQALDMRRSLGHRPGEAASLNSIGAAHFALGEFQPALDYFKKALDLERAIGVKEKEAITLFGIAMTNRALGNLSEARLRMQESLDVIESLRGTAANQDLRALFLSGKQDYYEFYTDLLVRMHKAEPSKGYDRDALQASERARARSLVELLAEARIDVDQGITPELKQRERATNSRIAWIQGHLIAAYSASKPDQSAISSLEDELKKVDAEREQLNTEIRQKHPRYAELRYPAPLELASIQALLDDRTALLEYAIGDTSSYLFAVSRSDFLIVALPSTSALAGKVDALRQIITSQPQRSTFGKQIEYSRQLFRELIEPAGKLLAGKQKLIIAPSGVLNYLPFEVLLSSGDEKELAAAGPGALPFLIRDYAIGYVPSAGVLAGLRSRPQIKPGPRKTFLAFADPVYGDETGTETNVALRGAFGQMRAWKLTRLEGSRREVEQIASLYKPDQASLLLGEQASEQNVKTDGRLSQYRYVHFATHGLVNEERPPYSGLILSLPTGKESAAGNAQSRNPQSPISNPQSEDGLLQVYEVFNLKLNADLVVLSACDTGLGKEIKGEGLIGLTRAFLYAGTPSVMVSLWSVQDRSTADLMVRFYQQLDRRKDKAAALRQAKLDLIQTKRYAHPYYWAPFILIGDPE